MAFDMDEENDADIMMLAAAAVVIIEANEDPEDRLIVKDIIELEEHMFARNFVLFYNGSMRWIEIVNSRHPRRMHDAIRMQPHSFEMLFHCVNDSIPSDGKVSVFEKVFILLDWLGQGTSVRQQHESFNRSISTCHSSRHEALQAVLENLSHNIRLPESNAEWRKAREKVETEDKFLEFDGAFGAIDGSHIGATRVGDAWRNRKGLLTQNVLLLAAFDMSIMFVAVGAEGAAPDGLVLRWSGLNEILTVEQGFVLGDAGYALTRLVLVPYRGVRYLLAEWARGNSRPQNAKELFNLRHAQLRNVVERVFGVLKKRFRVLRSPIDAKYPVQQLVVYACCALHNFLLSSEGLSFLDEENDLDDDEVDDDDENICDDAGVNGVDDLDARAFRDDIANRMWEDYQKYLERRESKN